MHYALLFQQVITIFDWVTIDQVRSRLTPLTSNTVVGWNLAESTDPLQKTLTSRDTAKWEKNLIASESGWCGCIGTILCVPLVCILYALLVFYCIFVRSCVDRIHTTLHELADTSLAHLHVESCLVWISAGQPYVSLTLPLLLNTKLYPWQMVQLHLTWPLYFIMYGVKCEEAFDLKESC